MVCMNPNMMMQLLKMGDPRWMDVFSELTGVNLGDMGGMRAGQGSK